MGGSRNTHLAASHRSVAAAPSSTRPSTSMITLVSVVGERKTSWLSGIWRRSLCISTCLGVWFDQRGHTRGLNSRL